MVRSGPLFAAPLPLRAGTVAIGARPKAFKSYIWKGTKFCVKRFSTSGQTANAFGKMIRKPATGTCSTIDSVQCSACSCYKHSQSWSQESCNRLDKNALRSCKEVSQKRARFCPPQKLTLWTHTGYSSSTNAKLGPSSATDINT